MEKIKLLFVEDNADLSFIIKHSLEITQKYTVETASDGHEGIKKYKKCKPDVIVSDIMMEGMSGLDMVKEIRKLDNRVPIILVSGEKKEPDDIVDGLKSGVNNYILKPYTSEVLDRYIQALFRKDAKQTRAEHCYLGNFTFDRRKQYLKWGGKTFKLTTREADVLWMLWLEKDEIVERTKLLTDLWGSDNLNNSRSLDVVIYKLRKHLQKDPCVQIITIKRNGFRLVSGYRK